MAGKVGWVSLRTPHRPAWLGGVDHRDAHVVVVPLYDGVQSLDVSGPVEVLTGAATGLADAPGRYVVVTASPGGRPVRTSSGLGLVPDVALEDAPEPATVLVPGGPGTRDARSDDVAAWLAARRGHPSRTVSVCSGAFLLAAAGHLDGRRATTHWSLTDVLARRYPQVDVVPDALYVHDDGVWTSAGVTAGIDLTLALVEVDHGRDLALAVARHLVVHLRRPGSQAQFSAELAAQEAGPEPVRELQRWILAHPAADLSVEALAARVALSPRQLSRVFRAAVGTTPGRYVDLVRLDRAKRLLVDTRDTVDRVARLAGYRQTEAMRRAFAKELATTPAEFRARFTTAVRTAPTTVAASASTTTVPPGADRPRSRPSTRE